MSRTGSSFDYSLIRHKLKSGDVAMYYASNLDPIEQIVRITTKSPWVHCGLIMTLGGRIFLLESTLTTGVRMIPLSHKIPCRIIRLRDEIQWNDDAEITSLNLIGESYSILDAARAGFGMRQNNGGYICSEYVARVLQDMRVYMDEWGNTPVQLMDRVIKSAGVEVIDLM